MKIAWLLTIALLALGPVEVALADDAKEAAEVNKAGEDLYPRANSTKDPVAKRVLLEDVHRKFRKAYELDARPRYLFNVAQSARFLDNCPRALAAFTKLGEQIDAGEAESDLTEEAIALVRDQLVELPKSCEASDEFQETKTGDTVASPPDEKGEAGDGKPNTETTSITDEPDLDLKGSGGSGAGKWWVAGVASGVVAIGLGGYASYEHFRLIEGGHFDQKFSEVVADEPSVGDPSESGNRCDHPGIQPGPKQVCDDGDSASLRRGFALGGAIGMAALSGFFVYKAVTSKAEKPPRTAVGIGPGDLGLSLMTRF